MIWRGFPEGAYVASGGAVWGWLVLLAMAFMIAVLVYADWKSRRRTGNVSECVVHGSVTGRLPEWVPPQSPYPRSFVPVEIIEMDFARVEERIMAALASKHWLDEPKVLLIDEPKVLLVTDPPKLCSTEEHDPHAWIQEMIYNHDRVLPAPDVLNPVLPKLNVSEEHYLVHVRDQDVYSTVEWEGSDRSVGIMRSFATAAQLFDTDGNRLLDLEKSLTQGEWESINEQLDRQTEWSFG